MGVKFQLYVAIENINNDNRSINIGGSDNKNDILLFIRNYLKKKIGNEMKNTLRYWICSNLMRMERKKQ
jgi:hypothetical protein